MDGPLLAFVGGAIGAVLGILGTLRAQEVQHSSAVIQKRLDLRLRQLNDFYAPMYIARRRAESQRRMLPDYEDAPDAEGRSVRWRLVNHIEEAKKNSTYAEAVEVILAAGDEMVTIIMSSSGLVTQSRVPEAFQQFIDHHDRLRRSWRDGVSEPVDERLPFPGGVASGRDLTRCTSGSRTVSMDADIDCAIYLGLRWVQDDIAAITEVKDFKGSPVFELLDPLES